MAEDLRSIGIENITIDANTHALTFLDYEHHEVHEGDHFTLATYDEDMDNTEVKNYILTAPASPVQVHLVIEVAGAATTLVQLFEDTTHVSTDTAITSYNNNRNSTDTASLTVQLDSTTDAGSDGTQIDAASFGLDTGVGAGTVITAGDTRARLEWILKYSAVYCLKITSNADNNNVNLRLSWYEHTAKA